MAINLRMIFNEKSHDIFFVLIDCVRDIGLNMIVLT